MQITGAVTPDNPIANSGDAGGKSSLAAGGKQTNPAFGGFEGILEQIAALLSANQADGQGMAASGVTVTTADSLVSSAKTALETVGTQESSQDSKQNGVGSSQIPNGNSHITKVKANAMAMAQSTPAGKLAAAMKANESDSASAGVQVSNEGTASDTDTNVTGQQGSAVDTSLDANVIAAAAAAAMQAPVAQPAAAEKSFTGTVNLLGLHTQTSAVGTFGTDVPVSGTKAALPQPIGVTTGSGRAGTDSFAARIQGESAKTSSEVTGAALDAVAGQAKKAATDADAKTDAATNASSLTPNEKAQDAKFDPSVRFAQSGKEIATNVTQMESNAAQSATQSASLTKEELLASRPAVAKKESEVSKNSAYVEPVNFATAVRTEMHQPTSGAAEKAVASDLSAQGATNPFGVMDSAPTSSEQQAHLLRATSKEIEVGVHDPHLGWVEVKTQMDSGHVSASLSVSSAEAQHALQQELPAMQHFVAGRDLDLSSLSVSTGTENGAGAFNQQAGQGSGSQNQPLNQSSVGEAWQVQSASNVSSTTATERVWMPETASRISVMA